MPEVLILNTDDCCYGVLRVRCVAASRERTAAGDLDNLGGHSGGDTPLPIPNREVKPASADGTRGASPRESRTPPSFFADRDPRVAGSRSRDVEDVRSSRPHPSLTSRVTSRLEHGAPRRRSRAAAVDRGRRRRDRRRLQRPRSRAVDSDDPAPYTRGGCARVHRGECAAPSTRPEHRRSTGRVVGGASGSA